MNLSPLTDLWDGMRTQPGRVALSFLAIAVGIAALTVLIAVLDGLEARSKLIVHELGVNVLQLRVLQRLQLLHQRRNRCTSSHGCTWRGSTRLLRLVHMLFMIHLLSRLLRWHNPLICRMLRRGPARSIRTFMSWRGRTLMRLSPRRSFLVKHRCLSSSLARPVKLTFPGDDARGIG